MPGAPPKPTLPFQTWVGETCDGLPSGWLTEPSFHAHDNEVTRPVEPADLRARWEARLVTSIEVPAASGSRALQAEEAPPGPAFAGHSEPKLWSRLADPETDFGPANTGALRVLPWPIPDTPDGHPLAPRGPNPEPPSQIPLPGAPWSGVAVPRPPATVEDGQTSPFQAADAAQPPAIENAGGDGPTTGNDIRVTNGNRSMGAFVPASDPLPVPPPIELDFDDEAWDVPLSTPKLPLTP